MALKIKGCTIDLGKDGKFGPGKEEAFLKAVKNRKDSKSFLKHLEDKGFIEDTSKSKSSGSKKSGKKSDDDDKDTSKSKSSGSKK